MPQTRMFRDRVVSMEQTLEGGEKNLELLKTVCREALPEFAFREHALDHERDLFVMVLEAPDGRTRRVCWTRMTLYDAERIPALTGDPASPLRIRIVEFLRAHAARPEIVVTFRHLEDGWVDTPEPHREKKRRRGRGGERGRREGRREGGQPQPGGPPRPAARPGPRPGPPPQPSQRERERRREGPPPVAQAPGGAAAPDEAGKPAGGRRRRRFRRRRGRGPAGAPPSAPPGPAQSR